MNAKKTAVVMLIAIILIFVVYYLTSFAISIYSPFMMVVALAIVGAVLLAIKSNGSVDEAIYLGGMGGFTVGVVLVLILTIFNSSVFNTRAYSSLFTYVEKDFSTYQGSLDTIPLLDKVSSDNIAIRKFGELADYVSQYKVVDSEQIIYNSKPVRVSVLEHSGFWSWYRNKTTPGYILVDMQTQKAELVRTEKPVIYSEKARFGNNIKRYIRSNYKTALFFYPTAELNEEGELYWIAPTYHRIAGLYGGEIVDGLITVNAHTGEHQRYTNLDDIPEWVDNVYPSKYIMDQYDYKGKLSNGFWNTLFAKTGMTMTTDGYNYLPVGEDNWIYTGITSVSMADESNIAFIVTNKRTMETHYFPVTGAEEYSAMDAAEGEVQHLGYTSTFPLLLNIEGIPTYIVSLKDKNELVKMYAMVQVEDYRNVVVDSDLNKLARKYLNRVQGIDEPEVTVPSETGTSAVVTPTIIGTLHQVSGVLSDRAVINLDKESYIVFKLSGVDKIFITPVLNNMELLFEEIGAEIVVMAGEYVK